MLRYFNHVLHLPMNFFSTRKSGEIISRFLDATKIIDALANATLSLFLDASMVLLIGTALFFTKPSFIFNKFSNSSDLRNNRFPIYEAI